MKETYPLFGIVTVLNTPFTHQDSIDFHGLRRNVQLAVKAGVAGFLVPAMASEVNKLSRSERVKIVETVIDEVAGCLPVIAGAGEPDAGQRHRILRDLEAIGCDKVLLQIPYENDDQYTSEVLSAAAYGFEMLMLQDWDFAG